MLAMIFKVLSRIKRVRVIIQKLAKTLEDTKYFAVLFGLFLFVYIIIGMQFFANRFRFDQHGHPITKIYSEEWSNAYEVPFSNFDTFSNSFGTVFSVCTFDNWDQVMFSLVRSSGPASLLYLFSMVLVGSYIVFNLFFAILLGNFSDDDNDDDTATTGVNESDVPEGKGNQKSAEEELILEIEKNITRTQALYNEFILQDALMKLEPLGDRQVEVGLGEILVEPVLKSSRTDMALSNFKSPFVTSITGQNHTPTTSKSSQSTSQKTTENQQPKYESIDDAVFQMLNKREKVEGYSYYFL